MSWSIARYNMLEGILLVFVEKLKFRGAEDRYHVAYRGKHRPLSPFGTEICTLGNCSLEPSGIAEAMGTSALRRDISSER